MKKTLLICLALLAIVMSFFISCSVEPKAIEEEAYAYVEFDESVTRDFSAAYTPYSYDQLYWYYTAKKTDGWGTVGATGDTGTLVNSGKGLSGSIGPFSQGDWEFTLSAYTETSKSVLVYKTKDAIKASLYGTSDQKNPTKIKASVEPQQSTGTVAFKDAYFGYKNGGTSAPSLEMVVSGTNTGNNSKYTFSTDVTTDANKNEYKINLGAVESGKCEISFSDSTAPSLASGTYKCEVKAFFKSGDTSVVLGTGEFYFAVYGSATTTITGNLEESATSYVEFNVPEQVIQTLTIPQKSNDGTNFGKVTFGNTELGESTTTAPGEDAKVSETTKVELDLSAIMKTGDTGTDTDKKEITAITLTTEVVTGTEAANSFVIKDETTESGSSVSEDAKSAVISSISLTAKTQTGEEIGKSTEENKAGFGTTKSGAVTQTVTVFIGKGLNGGKDYAGSTGSDPLLLKIYYGGAEEKDNIKITKYNATTGYLTFTTTHFSTFVVVDTSQYPVSVKSGDNETYYESLAKAFAKATDNCTITLKKDITSIPNDITVSLEGNIKLDLNGKTIATGNQAPIVVSKGTVTVSSTEKMKQTSAVVKGVKVGDSSLTGMYYPSLKDACTAASENGTITLFGNTSVSDDELALSKNLTLNLNGYLLTTSSGKDLLTLASEKTLTVSGAASDQTAFVKGFKVDGSGMNGTYYSTFDEALTKVADSGVITLFDGVNLNGTTKEISKSLTLDLNGHVITSSARVFVVHAGTLTIKNGTIEATIKDNGNSVIKLDSITGNTKLVLEKDAKISAPNSYGITAFEDKEKGESYNNAGRTAELDIYGTIESYNPCIGGNGSFSYLKVTMNVYPGAVLNKKSSSDKKWTENDDKTAIYQPNDGILKIFGGTITCEDGSAVEIRAGEATISGGSLTGGGTYLSPDNPKYNGNGSTTVGTAVAVSQHTTKKDINVAISGGSFKGDKAIAVVDTLEETTLENQKRVKVTIETSLDPSRIVGFRVGNNTYYPTFEAALNVASSTGETVTLFDNVALESSIVINDGKSYIVDLNDHTISAKKETFIIEHGNVEFMGTGTIKETENDQYAPIVVKGSTRSTDGNYSVITVGKDITLNGWAGLFIRQNGNVNDYHAYGVIINMHGKIVTPTSGDNDEGGHGVYINGTIKDETGNVPEINLDGAEITSNNNAIYAAGYAKWNIKNTTINTEYNGIVVAAGEFEIGEGTTVVAGSKQGFRESKNGSITQNTSSAVYIKQHTYNPTIKVTVNGGSFSSYIPLYQDEGYSGSPAPAKVTLNITGGTFTGNSEEGSVSVKSENKTGFISGGTFSSDPSAYVQSGYQAKEISNGTWKVMTK